jgi:hypothetical protein
MKVKIAFLCVLVCVIVAAAVSQARLPQYPTDLAAGRPGIFRFSPQEQVQADKTELGELRIGIERLQLSLRTARDPELRRQVQAELERWQLHVNRMEARLYSSAGPTAATVEARLNGMKGARQCGVCHGGGEQPAPVQTGLP